MPIDKVMELISIIFAKKIQIKSSKQQANIYQKFPDFAYKCIS